MHLQNHSLHPDSLLLKMDEATGNAPSHCYQCGKCSAGCPMALEMDLPPSKIMRMLQYNEPQKEREVLGSESIWLCLTCGTCLARCPQHIDIPGIMDHFRSESLRQKRIHPRSGKLVSFQKSFMDSIRLTGKLFEVGLIAGYKMRTLQFLQDLRLVPGLLIRGKLGFLPHMVKDRGSMKRIFKKTLSYRKEERVA